MNCPERGFMPRKSLTEWSAKPLTFGMAPQVPSLVYPGVTSVNRSIEALKNLMFLRIFSGIRLPTNAMIIPTRTVSKVPEKPTQSTYISPQLSLSLFSSFLSFIVLMIFSLIFFFALFLRIRQITNTAKTASAPPAMSILFLNFFIFF